MSKSTKSTIVGLRPVGDPNDPHAPKTFIPVRAEGEIIPADPGPWAWASGCWPAS